MDINAITDARTSTMKIEVTHATERLCVAIDETDFFFLDGVDRVLARPDGATAIVDRYTYRKAGGWISVRDSPRFVRMMLRADAPWHDIAAAGCTPDGVRVDTDGARILLAIERCPHPVSMTRREALRCAHIIEEAMRDRRRADISWAGGTLVVRPGPFGTTFVGLRPAKHREFSLHVSAEDASRIPDQLRYAVTEAGVIGELLVWADKRARDR